MADLAAQTPGRYAPGSSRHGSGEESKTIRFTREKLLSMRPAPSAELPEVLRPLEGNAILSEEAQDPVCWDNFNAEEIWAAVPARRPSKAVPGGRSLSEMAESTVAVSGPPRGRREGASGSGRWQRGVALPPPSAVGNDGGKSRRDRDINTENPNDLWDDPVSGGAAGDFSAFGDTKDDGEDNLVAFDFEKMTQASQILEEELHGTSNRSRASSEGASVGSHGSGGNNNGGTTIPAVSAVVNRSVDSHRPLASSGTTIRSGSGDHVNVFEDFDEPMSSDSTPTAVDPLANDGNSDGKDQPSELKTEGSSSVINKNHTIPAVSEDVDATSRLMAMIGVSNPPSAPPEQSQSVASTEPEAATSVDQLGGGEPQSSQPVSTPWGLMPGSHQTGDKPLDGLSIPLNPWGGGALLQPSTGTDLMRHHQGGPSLLQPEPSAPNELKGLDLQARLREADLEQKAREQREELARQQERRRQEELEAQKRAAEMQQQQAVAARQQQQQQQQAGVQSQVELVLMERISIILENSWGRSDLMSILATLHAEDSRVIPLLNSIEALRALIARNSSRVALRHDPAFGAEMAVLLVTNSQWQQQQQEAVDRARRQEEEMRRREHEQRQMEEEQKQQTASEALRQKQTQETLPVIVPGAPWYYSDPQQNIQGPFRGEEMRQWYDAGYFKGDLPVSQDAGGPFRLLSELYPNLDLAFIAPGNQEQSNKETQQQQEEEAAAAAAEEEARRKAKQKEIEEEAEATRAREAVEAQERERVAQEEAAAKEKKAREAAESAERERRAASEAQRQKQSSNQAHTTDDARDPADGGNESSAQLKMMLGLPAQKQQQLQQEGNDSRHREQQQAAAPKRVQTKANNKKTTSPPVKATQQTPSTAPVPVQQTNVQPSTAPSAPKPATSAWGVSSNPKQVSRKSMSEIQQEEARLAALQAMQRERSGFSGAGSGWANVASKATTGGPTGGWSGSAAAKLSPAVVVANKESMMANNNMPKPTQVLRKQAAPVSTSRAQIANVAAINAASAKQNHHTTTAPSTSTDDFGAKMSPALEKWCKEQMMKLNGTDDLTLVSFCMTLNDPNEIRQYLITYLGSSPQVNNFANEFIHRKVGGKPAKAEEWETTVSNKKKGKKKTTTGGR